MNTKTKIKWRACGFDNSDRKGTFGIKEEVQIHLSVKKYKVAFHHATKATCDSLEEAKAHAELHVAEWMAERDAQQAAYTAQRKAEAARVADAQAREANLAARLQALGVNVRVGFGITLTLEVAQALVRRLEAAPAAPESATKNPPPELGLGEEMRLLMAC
jgi:hypothetical protein